MPPIPACGDKANQDKNYAKKSCHEKLYIPKQKEYISVDSDMAQGGESTCLGSMW